jgi:hypothetical protein
MPSIALTSAARHRLTAALWITNLASVIASNLAYLYLASLIYRTTGMISYANIVLMCPMVIPIIACVAISSATRTLPPRRIFIAANSTALLTAIVLALTLHAYPLVALAGAMSIGLADALQRVTRIVAIKVFFPQGNAKRAVPVALSAQFAAGGFSGVLMLAAPQTLTPDVMLGAIAGLFGLGAVASAFLPHASVRTASAPLASADHGAAHRTTAPVTVTSTGGFRDFFHALRSGGTLRASFLRAVAFVGLFQGFYNLSRVALPADLLHLSDRFVGLLQVLSSLSMIVGAIAFFAYGRKNRRDGARVEAIAIGVSVLAASAAVAMPHPATSFIAYCVYIFAFEFMFLSCQADLVESCPKDLVGVMATYQYAAMYVAILLVMALGNLVIDGTLVGHAMHPTHRFTLIAVCCGLAYGLLRLGIARNIRGIASPSSPQE